MPLTRSVAAAQRLGQDLADMIHRLGDYLKQVVTSQDPDWMKRIREWIRLILEKMREFYEKMAWAIGCKQSSLANSSELKEASSSAKEDIFKAVEMAMDMAGKRMDRSDELMFLGMDGIYEDLDAVMAKILALYDRKEREEEERAKEEDPKEEEPDEGYEAEDDED